MSILFLLAQAAAQTSVAAAEPQGVQSFPAAFFKAMNAANAYDMVGRIPGFTLDTGASVRGYEGAAGNVLIDGQRPSSKSDSIDQILQRIPIGDVERIDVIRGGAPGVDMQGKTILANVIRKKTTSLHGLVALAGGFVSQDQRTAPSLRLEAQGGHEGRAWEFSIRGGYGIDSGTGPGTEIKLSPTGQALSKNDIWARAGGWQSISAGSFETPLAGGQLRLNGRFFTNNYDSHETDTFTDPVGQLNRDHFSDESVETEVGARYSRRLGEALSAELVGLHTTKDENIGDIFTENPGPETRFHLHRFSTETIGRGVVKYRRNDRLSFEAGGEVADNTLQSKTRLSQNGGAIPIPAANADVEELRWEVFGKSVWRPTDTLTLEGVVRQEGSTIEATGDVRVSKTLGFTKPRIALTWQPTPAWQVRLRYEREVAQLNFDDFVATSSLATSTVTAGNPDLNPEQDWVSEVAVERDFWGAGSLIVTGRHYEITDAEDRAPIFLPDGSFFDAPANIGDGTKDELQVELTVPLDKLHMKGAQLKGRWIQRWSSVTDPTTHTSREISTLRPTEWEVHFSQPLPRWNANWGVDTSVGLPRRQRVYRSDVIQTTKFGGYVTPFIEWYPRRDIQLHFEVQDIFGLSLHDVREQYAGPRDRAPLQLIDDRKTRFEQVWYFRIRKFFGV